MGNTNFNLGKTRPNEKLPGPTRLNTQQSSTFSESASPVVSPSAAEVKTPPEISRDPEPAQVHVHIAPDSKEEEKKECIAPPKKDSQKPSKWKRPKAGLVCDQKNMTFLLPKICDNWQKVLPLLRKIDVSDSQFRMTSAAHDTLVALKDLYHMEHPGWREMRKHLRVSMYKETARCGNTSVCMGLAARFFKRFPEKAAVVFLNCGSGGTRFQVYTQVNKVISVLSEYKPSGDGSGPGALPDLHIEKNGKVLYEGKKTAKAISDEILALMADAPWKDLEFITAPDLSRKQTAADIRREILTLANKAIWKDLDFIEGLARGNITLEEFKEVIRDLDVYAFVTGPIREEYFKKNKAEQAIMNEAVQEVMRPFDKPPIKPFSQLFGKPDCFFLEEVLEGQNELLAIRTMHQQISQELNETQGGSEVLDPVISLGIGLSSVQWTCLKYPDSEEAVVFPYSHGMNNSAELGGFGKALIKYYEKPDQDRQEAPMDSLVRLIKACLAKNKIPVLALKSGAAMFLFSPKGDKIRSAFAADVESVDSQPIRVFYSFGNIKRAATFRRCVSMARLCADAQYLLGSETDFESVQIRNKPLKSPLLVQKDDVLEFSGTNANYSWWPDVESSQLSIRLPVTLVSQFNKQPQIEAQFERILKYYFSNRNQPTSYECIASVTKLLWDNLQNTSTRSLLGVGEKWFAQVVDIAARDPKLKEFMELQFIPDGGTFKPKTQPIFKYSNVPDESVQLNLLKHHIDFQKWSCFSATSESADPESILKLVESKLNGKLVAVNFVASVLRVILELDHNLCCICIPCPKGFVWRDSNPQSIPNLPCLDISSDVITKWQDKSVQLKPCGHFYLAVAKPKFSHAAGESQHTSVLKILHQVLGGIDSVEFPPQTKSGHVLVTFKDQSYHVQVELSKLRDKPSGSFLKAIYGLDEKIGGYKLGPPVTSVVPIINLLPLDDDEEEMKVGVSVSELKRILTVIDSQKHMRVVQCDHIIRMESGEGYLSIVVKWSEAKVPIFHEVRIRVRSQVERLQAVIQKLQNEERNARKGHAGPPLRNADLMDKASTFFANRNNCIPIALTQNQGDWVLFHRKAWALYHPFKRALEDACSSLQDKSLNVEMQTNVKSERSLQRKLRADALPNHIVPLSSIEETIDAVTALANKVDVEDDQDSVRALLATLSLLRGLWRFPNQKWLQLRGKLQIGLINETENEDNTSLSLGAASSVLVPSVLGSPSFGLLHSGTEGITYQEYVSQPSLRVSRTFKPDKGCFLNRLAVGDYKPDNPLTVQEAKAEFKSIQTSWSGAEFPVFFFVTGPIRDHWERANDDVKLQMEAGMRKVLKRANLQCLAKTYFITQLEEANMVLLGTQALYSNLEKKIGVTNVIGLLEIRKGSSQWVVRKTMPQATKTLNSGPRHSDPKPRNSQGDVNGSNLHDAKTSDSEFASYLHPHGMSSLERDDLTNKILTEDMNALIDIISSSPNPVIALKSGCLLLLERNSMIKNALLSPASFMFDYLRGTLDLPTTGVASVAQEIEATLRAINDHVGPIVRIKDQTQKGFLLVNVLFWHGVEKSAKDPKKSVPSRVFNQTPAPSPQSSPRSRASLRLSTTQTPTSPRSRVPSTLPAASPHSPTILSSMIHIHTVASTPSTGDEKKAQTETPEKSKDPKPQHHNLAMICEVQIRVSGAPDDHVAYEIRRNFGDATKSTVDALVDFFSAACNFAFCKLSPGAKLTLYQDSRGQICQAFDNQAAKESSKERRKRGE